MWHLAMFKRQVFGIELSLKTRLQVPASAFCSSDCCDVETPLLLLLYAVAGLLCTQTSIVFGVLLANLRQGGCVCVLVCWLVCLPVCLSANRLLKNLCMNFRKVIGRVRPFNK